MKSLITLAILTALLLVGSADTPISTIKSDSHSFSNDVNITITPTDAYAAVNFTSQMEEINYNQKFNIEG